MSKNSPWVRTGFPASTVVACSPDIDPAAAAANGLAGHRADALPDAAEERARVDPVRPRLAEPVCQRIDALEEDLHERHVEHDAGRESGRHREETVIGALRSEGDDAADAGRHARTTIGVPSLPADAAVEVEGMFELE